MTGQTCALPGCFKPPCLRPGSTPFLTCGKLHHQLLMAIRLNPDPYLRILQRNDEGFCALSSCEEPPHEGHSWCSRTHYLRWLAEFTSCLHADHQICMLPGCTRHVYVYEDGSPPSKFCGWRHKQEAVRLSALQHGEQEALCPSAKISSTQQPMQLPASLKESQGGHQPSVKSRLHSLKQVALLETCPQDGTVIDKDFYDKHPWEVFKEGGHACWLIAHPKFIRGLRDLTTKGSYHWKQSGRQSKKYGCPMKYYTYKKRSGKEKQDDHHKHYAESSYTMQEFILKDVTSHSLIYLVKDKRSSNGKHGKEPPCNHQISEYPVDYACVQDTGTISDLHRDHGSVDHHGSCQNGSTDSDPPPMLEEGIAQAPIIGLDMFTHGEGDFFTPAQLGLDMFTYEGEDFSTQMEVGLDMLTYGEEGLFPLVFP